MLYKPVIWLGCPVRNPNFEWALTFMSCGYNRSWQLVPLDLWCWHNHIEGQCRTLSFFEIEISHKLREPNADYLIENPKLFLFRYSFKIKKIAVIWQIFRQTVRDELHNKFLRFRILKNLLKNFRESLLFLIWQKCYFFSLKKMVEYTRSELHIFIV